MRRNVVLLILVLLLRACSSPANISATQTREANLSFLATFTAPNPMPTLTPKPTLSIATAELPLVTGGLPTATGGPPIPSAYAADMNEAFLYVGAAIQRIAGECGISIERCTSAYTLDQNNFGRGALRLRNLPTPPPACRDLRSRYLEALVQADAYLADLDSAVKQRAWPKARDVTNRDVPPFTLTVNRIGSDIKTGTCH